MFGEYIKQKRLEKNFTLREFCRAINEDASNWSKIERGLLPPPQGEDNLKQIAKVLDIDLEEIINMASVSAGKIPEAIINDQNIMNELPLFFRTIGNVKPTAEEIKKLIQAIKDNH